MLKTLFAALLQFVATCCCGCNCGNQVAAGQPMCTPCANGNCP